MRGYQVLYALATSPLFLMHRREGSTASMLQAAFLQSLYFKW